MYELRQLSDVWPTLRGSQSLKSLLQEHYDARKKANLKVWVHPGHVIVAHGQTVLSFDVLPRSKHILGSAGSALYSQEQKEPDWLCMTDCSAPLVHVFCPGQDHSLAALVFADGKIEFWRFLRPQYKWVAANFIHLMTSELLVGYERMEVASVSWLEDRHSLVACYSTPRSFSRRAVVGERPASNRFSVGVWRLDDAYQTVESCQAVFTQCPVMSFTSVKSLVCLQPSQPTLPGLLLFWLSEKSLIQPYLCGSERSHAVQEMACPVNFTSLISKTVGSWLQLHSGTGVLAATASRRTDQILILQHDGQIVSSQLKKGHVHVSKAARLHPWSALENGHEVGNGEEKPRADDVAYLLAQRNFLILSQPDQPLRVFDVRTGSQLWHTIDLQLTGSKSAAELWQFPTAASTVGAWNCTGLWMLQAKPVLDQAEAIMKHSDATDLPDESTVTRCCRAAQLCMDWNQSAAAVRFSLQGASQLSKVPDKDGEIQQEVPEELIKLLNVDGLESPALLLPALVKFPSQRQRLVSIIASYLKRYKTSSPDTASRLLRSSLSAEIVPLLQEFMSLAEQYEQLLGPGESAALAQGSSGEVQTEVLRLITSQQVLSGPIEANQAQLDLLAHRSPALVLASVKEFLDVPDFNEALASVYQDDFQSAVNWESVLLRDNTFFQAADSLVTTRFPLFDVLCRLLNAISPDELVAFVEFAGQVIRYDDDVDAAFVHHDKEHYFVQRALAALPLQFPDGNSPSSKATSPSTAQSEAAMLAHSKLLLKSGQPLSGLTAARYLVTRQLWSQVFELARVLAGNEEKGSAQSTELFHMILVALIENNQLHRYWQTLMKLRPPSLTSAFLLTILQKYVPVADKSQLDSSGMLIVDPNGPLTVDVIRGMLLQML
eukprot:scpid36037/ scgid11940/ 